MADECRRRPSWVLYETVTAALVAQEGMLSKNLLMAASCHAAILTCCCCEQGCQHMLKSMLEVVVAQMQHLGITSQALTMASGALATPGAERIIPNQTFCSLLMYPGPPVPAMLLIGR